MGGGGFQVIKIVLAYEGAKIVENDKVQADVEKSICDGGNDEQENNNRQNKPFTFNEQVEDWGEKRKNDKIK